METTVLVPRRAAPQDAKEANEPKESKVRFPVHSFVEQRFLMGGVSVTEPFPNSLGLLQVFWIWGGATKALFVKTISLASADIPIGGIEGIKSIYLSFNLYLYLYLSYLYICLFVHHAVHQHFGQQQQSGLDFGVGHHQGGLPLRTGAQNKVYNKCLFRCISISITDIFPNSLPVTLTACLLDQPTELLMAL